MKNIIKLFYIEIQPTYVISPIPHRIKTHFFVSFPGGGGGLSSILSSLGGFGGGNLLSTALPLMMVVGLGAMLVPLLGGAFFRESQKRGLPSVSPAFLEGVTDILEKFIKALDAVEKKYP